MFSALRILDTTILNCGVLVRSVKSNVYSEDRYDSINCFVQLLTVEQTLYHRRVRKTDCVVGDQPKAKERIEKNCICTKADFEWSVFPPSIDRKVFLTTVLVNSTTSGTKTTSVSSLLGPHRYPANRRAGTARTTGTS